MTPAECAEYLRQYNAWRRGDDSFPMPVSKSLGGIIDAAIEHLESMSWQPISTAPKDGQMIIAHNAIIGGSYVVGWHKGNLPLDLEDVPHWTDCPNQNTADALWFNHLYFTHWMPLSAVPKGKS